VPRRTRCRKPPQLSRSFVRLRHAAWLEQQLMLGAHWLCPSSTSLFAQLSSTPLHCSMAPGRTLARPSLQSAVHGRYPSPSTSRSFIGRMPSQSSSSALQVSAAGATVPAEHCSHIWHGPTRPSTENAFMEAALQPATVPARHCPAVTPQVMPYCARFISRPEPTGRR
jgi:hypothetical protein